MFYVFHVYCGYGTMTKARTMKMKVLAASKFRRTVLGPLNALFTRNFPKIGNIRLVYPSPIQPVKEKALKALSMGWCASS